MLEETFVAPSPKEAFALAKKKYGHFSELVLLKAIQIKNAEGEQVSQITVSVSSSDFFESIGFDEEEELAKEIHALKDQIGKMKQLVAPESSAEEKSVLETIRALMLQKGLSDTWLEETLRDIGEESIVEDEELLFSYILDEMDEKLMVKSEDLSQKKILMLIGSTGVGKTTTIAKLAARYALLLEHPLKVALVNLDTFRVGAYEHLEHYASQMQIIHVKVERVDGFSEVLNQLKGYDVVLIDTAGISPYDTGKLIKTIEFLKSTGDHKIETSLVISATAKKEDISDVYEHFSFLDIGSAILTKFDETRRVGGLFSFLIEKQIPVSYISNGQQVPDDLEVADREKLMERFVGEFNA